MNISESQLALITGIVGSITGVASLIWHILNQKPKIIINSIYFRKENSVQDSKEGELQHIYVKIRIKNKGNRSSTIEDVSVRLGNRIESPNFQLPRIIKENSSEVLSNYIIFKKKEFDSLYKNGLLDFEVYLEHTFGSIRKFGKDTFETGHFTIA